jgi:hypothetical protein
MARPHCSVNLIVQYTKLCTWTNLRCDSCNFAYCASEAAYDDAYIAHGLLCAFVLCNMMHIVLNSINRILPRTVYANRAAYYGAANLVPRVMMRILPRRVR